MHHRTSSLPHAGPKMISPQSRQQKCGEESLRLLSKMRLQINMHQQGCIRSNIDEGRANNKILIRRHRHRIKKEEPAAEANLRKTFNYKSRKHQQQEEQDEQVHHSQKAKFINILQSKVIKSNGGQSPKSENKKGNQSNPIKLNSTRYNNYNSNTFRINQSHQKQGNQNQERKSYRLSIEDRPKMKSQRQRKEESHIISFRSRSRTINKELLSLKKIGSTGQLQKNQISRTIQITQFEQNDKIYKSLVQMEKFEKQSFGRQTKEVRKNQISIAQEEKNTLLVIQNPLIKKDSMIQTQQTHILDAQQYQREINMLTKEFLHQWQKMNTNKSKIYTSLRRKMALLFPNLKKHYEQFKQPSQQNEVEVIFQKQKVVDLMMLTNNLKSDQRGEKNINISSNNSFLNQNNISEVKDVQQKLDEFHQKQMLKQIFKQAYFWSRTKNKFMSTNFLNQQQTEKMQMVHLKRIQKDLTFMNYIKGKNGNKSQVISNKRKIKGTNIIKNKQSILEMEKQGTRQQQFLKKCLDNAIENCIRQFT